MPIVLEEPSKGPRLWNRRWEGDRWRGSPGDLLAAAFAAREEIIALGLGTGMIESVEVGYADDSEQGFGSLDAWRDDPSLKSPQDIRSLRIALDGVTAKVTMEGGPDDGLVVVAEGSETFANGIRATMKSRLSGGADAGQEAAKAVPIPKGQRSATLIAAIVAAGIGVLLYTWQGKYDRDVIGPSLLGFALFAILMFPIVSIGAEERNKRLPPSFELVPEGEQFATEDEATDGPIWSAKRWFDNHPLLKWAGTLVLGGLIGALIGHALYA